MKVKFNLVVLIVLTFISVNISAQEITLTTTSKNLVSSRAAIEMNGLAGNAGAIIVAAPLGETEKLNPHPIGAWYYNDKWNIFNTDHAAMPSGLQYKVQVFLKPDANHFLHVVSKENLGEEGSYLDHPLLNNDPNAQVKILQNHAPDNRSPYNLNPFEAKAFYNPNSGKWYIANVNGKNLSPNTAYNVVVISGGAGNANSPPAKPSPAPSPTVAVLIVPAPPTPVKNSPAPDTRKTPAPSPSPSTANAETAKAMQLVFDNLNDFVGKGLPAPAAVAPKQTLDQAAVTMARQISEGNEDSLPILLTALQTAGFTIIDENGAVLRKPAGGGKGLGLGFYDFEAVGSLKLAQRGVTVSLEKMAGTMVKDVPQMSAARLTDLILADLRAQADDRENPYLRFYARLIIELGKASAEPFDLTNAAATPRVRLTMLQASLLTRRLQGDVYLLKNKLKQIGRISPNYSQRDSFVFAKWEKNAPPFSAPFSAPAVSACNLTGDEALIMDAAALGLTTGHSKWLELLGDSPTLAKISGGLSIVNSILAWGKLVSALTALRGEITVDNPPVIRTLNSTPGNKRLMTARVWSEVGKKELLNCLRPALNLATGLDFSVPTDGPLADTFIEWQFEGDAATNLASKKFVFFEPPPGADRKPNKQLTDSGGISKMYLVGSPKIPAVAYMKNPVKVTKKAQVLVRVTLKSSKDFVQNWIDIGGAVIGGLVGSPGTAAEILFRLPYDAARASVPVIDHENPGFRATGKTADVAYSGVICSLEKPFTVSGSIINYSFKFTPSSPTAGTVAISAAGMMVTSDGGGTYTIEGADTDQPRIAVAATAVGTSPFGSRTGSGMLYINLIPLDTNECN